MTITWYGGRIVVGDGVNKKQGHPRENASEGDLANTDGVRIN